MATASLTGFHLGLLVGCTIKVAAPTEGRVDCDRFNPASPLVLSLRPTSINTASVLVSASYAAPPRSSSARRPDPATLRPLGSHVVSSILVEPVPCNRGLRAGGRPRRRVSRRHFRPGPRPALLVSTDDGRPSFPSSAGAGARPPLNDTQQLLCLCASQLATLRSYPPARRPPCHSQTVTPPPEVIRRPIKFKWRRRHVGGAQKPSTLTYLYDRPAIDVVPKPFLRDSSALPTFHSAVVGLRVEAQKFPPESRVAYPPTKTKGR